VYISAIRYSMLFNLRRQIKDEIGEYVECIGKYENNIKTGIKEI
jgi:hypothetical protein